MRLPILRTGPWSLADLPKPDGPTVFSCFAGGGGSSMGYRLAGMQPVGACELDPQMAALYEANLWKGKRPPAGGPGLFVGSVTALPTMEPPKDLDVLDGSPPCSSFSLAGDRHDTWGMQKKFREGQASQVLDELFFHFIAVAKAWRPRYVVAENVKGMLLGKAKGYCLDVLDAFKAAGYKAQLVLLNASRMGVPQRRERVVFIAHRDDLKLPELRLDFNEPLIVMREALKGVDYEGERVGPAIERWWKHVPVGDYIHNYHPRSSFFCHKRMHPDDVCPTITGSRDAMLLWDKPRTLTDAALVRLQTFPEDYNFQKLDPCYVLGMSVPPFMMQRLALQLRQQWLDR